MSGAGAAARQPHPPPESLGPPPSDVVGGNAGLGNSAVNSILFSLLHAGFFALASLGLFFLFFKKGENNKIGIAASAGFIVLLIAELWIINNYYIEKSFIKKSDFYRPDNVTDFFIQQSAQEVFRVGTALHAPVNGEARPVPITGLRGYYLTYIFPYFQIQPMDIPAISGSIPAPKPRVIVLPT